MSHKKLPRYGWIGRPSEKIDVRAYNRKDFSRQQNSSNSNSPGSVLIIRPMTQVEPASSYGIPRWVGFEFFWQEHSG